MMPLIRQIRTKEEFEAVVAAARKEKHVAFAPTHVVTKENEPVGYFSIGHVPVVMTWLSPLKLVSRESLHLINSVENMIAGSGQPGVIVPCTEWSPFHPKMERLGFRNLGQFSLFTKEFYV